MVKNLQAMQEILVRSLGREDSLEKGMAIHSSILAWRIPWTEEPGSLQPLGVSKSQTQLIKEHFHSHIYYALQNNTLCSFYMIFNFA